MASPLVRVRMIARLLATSMIKTSSGGATKPLMTAVQNNASMGLMPTKLINMPTTVATTITP